MTDYAIKIKTSDMHLLPVTNIGPYINEPIENSEYSKLVTDSKQAFDAWCSALKSANREFEIFPI
ncbi:MAG: hypothetical protein WCI11_04280 [Candidatus Methylumidiphilus sp.]